uniref:Kelch-like protein diablo n=1 Tax=Glossina brevipalpis TaxID=37001 RepID=A0A1A9X443_9MUSC
MANNNDSSIDTDGNGNKVHVTAEHLNKEIYCELDYISDPFVGFHKIRENRKFFDLSLQVNDKIINVHKVVLAAASPFFHAMLTIEGNDDEGSVKILDIDEEILEQIIEAIYSGKIIVTGDNVQRLLSASTLLQIEWLIIVCCEFLKDRLIPSNCLGILKLADTCGCMKLYNKCQDYIRKHYLEIVNTEEHLLLSFEQIRDLVKSNEIIVDSEINVFNAIMKWIKYNPEKRLMHLAELFKYVRLSLISTKSLMNCVAIEPYIKNNPLCKDFLMEAMEYHLKPEERCLLSGDWTKERKPSGMKPRVVLISGCEECQMYDNYFESKFLTAPMHLKRSHAGASSSHNLLYAVGGKTSSTSLNNAECYNPLTNTWTDIPPMSVKRYNFGISNVGDMIYVCGGNNEKVPHHRVECYDILTSKWITCPNMISNLEGVRATMSDNCIYCVGTMVSQTVMERFDPREGQWCLMPHLLNFRKSTDIASQGSYLFCSGGLNSSNLSQTSGERFDVRRNKWEPISSMLSPKYGHSLVEMDDDIYAIGGDKTFAVECYNVGLNEWNVLQSVHVEHAYGGAAVVNSFP